MNFFFLYRHSDLIFCYKRSYISRPSFNFYLMELVRNNGNRYIECSIRCAVRVYGRKCLRWGDMHRELWERPWPK